MKTGIWLIGAFGNVATCVITGVEALKRGLISKTGLVTELEEFKGLDLIHFDDIIFGGHEVRSGNLYKSALEFQESNGVIQPKILEKLRKPLLKISKQVKPGISLNCSKSVEQFSERSKKDKLSLMGIVKILKDDFQKFKKKNRLDTVVVVNLASVEPFSKFPETILLPELQRIIEKNKKEKIPASILYAYSALDAGFPFINFTSSIGSSLSALDELARLKKVPHMGKDGKTGETLVKTALAPMFLARHFKVLSWEGHNILGNRDGLVLKEPACNKAKVKDKDEVLKKILPSNSTHSNVRIDYVPSLEDWKVAWDFIHFAGFLDTKMSMQYIWQGADSALAAPLVIDMVRLVEFAKRKGESGKMAHLACFFKTPFKVEEQDFHKQFEMLKKYIVSHSKRDV